ncbi:3-methylcrotonyl-CoA carboxylase [Shewanella kaireitica]|nr:3-methylcrotonyl-CoA carboxylase [Shewanella kaireitica]MCL1093359.1 3-methylcrotonyl-CoA carboxylase [Shewanella kaireitica]
MDYITSLESPYDGIVSAFFFNAGELVSDGILLAEVTTSEEE